MNSPGGNTISTAELAVGLMLSLARNIPAADSAMKAEKFDRKALPASSCMERGSG